MSETIVIRKLNEVYMHLSSQDQGIYFELESFFKFRPDKFQFHPKFKAKQWDGYIRPFSPAKRLLYVGLLGYLREFCKQRGYNLDIHPESIVDRSIQYNEVEVNQYIDSIKIHSDGKEITINEHQREAIHVFLKNRRNILILPTASGKSLVLYILARYMLEHDKKILIVVPTVALVKQLLSDFKEYSSEDDFDIEALTHLIFSGEKKTTSKPITITTYQSIASNKKGEKVDPEWFEKYGAVFVDEAHTCTSASIQYILENSRQAEYRLGVTGTIDASTTNPITLTGLLGNIQKIITTKELQELGIVSDIKIHSIVLKYNEESRKLVSQTIKNTETNKNKKGMSYDEEIKFIRSHTRRNLFIRDLAVNSKGTTLVLCHYVEEHLLPLHKMITEKVGDSRKVFLIYGKIDKDERERIRKIVDNHPNSIIVSNYQTMSTGINIRSIHNVIFAHPLKGMVKILQSIGRSLRLFDGKDRANLYDIADDLTYKRRTNYTLDHFLDRLNIYDNESFNYKVHEVEIE